MSKSIILAESQAQALTNARTSSDIHQVPAFVFYDHGAEDERFPWISTTDADQPSDRFEFWASVDARSFN